MRDMRETLRATFGRVLRGENRRRAMRRGALVHVEDFTRPVTVYLPPGYESGDARYPVLYMQDGQNLFEPERAFIPGQHWRLNDAADRAINERSAEPMIIVGVDHAGPARIDEYTPTRDDSRGSGGRAAAYANLLIDELKPVIDSRFRTRPDDTSAGGSSLGGLVALYLGLTRPDVFRRLAAMSPSVWWDGRAILELAEHFEGPRPRLWLDTGGREGRDAVRDVRLLRERLLQKGWSDADLSYREDPRGDHSERAWARRAGPMLEFLFPPV